MLPALTQKLAYQAIRQTIDGKTPPRRLALRNMNDAIEELEQWSGMKIKMELLWLSTRRKDTDPKLKVFMWRCFHEAFKVGDYWDAMKEPYKDYGTCKHCDCVESMNHILSRCEARGQELIWSQARTLWEKRSDLWYYPNLGTIAGNNTIDILDKDGRKLPGDMRLLRILIAESVYQIWLVRNKRVLEDDNQIASEEVIINKWRKAIGSRFKLDRQLAGRKRGSKRKEAIRQVKQTWTALIQDESNLPKHWEVKPEVLVGLMFS
jgi:hypothetical protein